MPEIACENMELLNGFDKSFAKIVLFGHKSITFLRKARGLSA